MRTLLLNFRPNPMENLYEAWERFKGMQRACPHHGTPKWTLLQVFYTNSNATTKQLLDQVAGGAFMNKDADEGEAIIENIAQNIHLWENPRESTSGGRDLREVRSIEQESLEKLKSQHESLVNEFRSWKVEHKNQGPSRQPSKCDVCFAEGHDANSCPSLAGSSTNLNSEDLNYMGQGYRHQGGYFQGDLTNPTYHPSNRNHPNFSLKNENPTPPGFNPRSMPNPNFRNHNQGGPSAQPSNQPNQNSLSLEQTLNTFMASQIKQNSYLLKQGEETKALLRAVNARMEVLEEQTKNLSIQNKLIESQIAQNASNSPRVMGSLPSKTEPNPKAQVNAMFLNEEGELEVFEVERIEYGKGFYPSYPLEDSFEASVEHESNDVDAITLKSGKQINENLIKEPPKDKEHEDSLGARRVLGEASSKDKGKAKVGEPGGSASPNALPTSYGEPIPFPNRLKKARENVEFSKFCKIMGKLDITLPLVDLLEQAPNYAKFLKQIVSKKRKFEEEEGSHNIQQTLFLSEIPKLGDPGSFTIPCQIGSFRIPKCLVDLGASVSVMPSFLFDQIALTNLESTPITIRLADGSTRIPKGIVKNTSINIGDLTFPCDFIVMDVGSNKDIPMILGRPFLATAGTRIDVKNGSLTFEYGNKKIGFDISNMSNVCCDEFVISKGNPLYLAMIDEITHAQEPTHVSIDEGGPSKEPNKAPTRKPSNATDDMDKGKLLESISRAGLHALMAMGVNFYEFEREVRIFEQRMKRKREKEESSEEEDPSEGTWEEEEEDPSEDYPLEGETEQGELSHHSWKASPPIKRESSPIFLPPPPTKLYNALMDDPNEADSHILPFAGPILNEPSPPPWKSRKPRMRVIGWKEVKKFNFQIPRAPD